MKIAVDKGRSSRPNIKLGIAASTAAIRTA
jgi:hypothetical protein